MKGPNMMTAEKKDTADRLNETGRCAYAAIAEMVAALNCDYDRLAELRDERQNLEGDELKDFDEQNSEELDELTDAAGDCEDRDEAERRIREDALSVQVRSDWYSPGSHDLNDLAPGEYEILLSTGGPATRIVGDLDRGEPISARLEVQDWFLPWTEYTPADEQVLLDYARCFYFGE